MYFCYSCPILTGSKRLHFKPDGSWELFDNGQRRASGTAQLVSWPRYSGIVTFKLGPNEAPINLAYPFGSFMFRNGPPDWPIIEYVAR